MMSIFLGHLWIFELTYIVFELGLVNAIYIFNSSNNSETFAGALELFN